MLEFNQKTFLKEVRDFMKAHELSCRKFAEISGVAFVTLYRLENDTNEISLRTIRKLEKAMKNYKEDII